MALNHITVMGRLTRNPELRQTTAGVPVCGFSIAVDRDFKNSNGEKETDFFDIVTYRNTAEFVSKYFIQGSVIVVSGRLQTRKWTDREGNKRSGVEIVADSVYFGGGKREEGGSYGGEYTGTDSGYYKDRTPSNVAPPAPAPAVDDFSEVDFKGGSDDLPF